MSMQKITFGILALSVICPVALWFAIEAYIPFSPYIGTSFSQNFSLDKWSAVKTGMTQSEVHALLGMPLSRGGHKGYIDCEMYSEDGGTPYWDFAWVAMSVCYDSIGYAIAKNEFIMHD